MICDICLLLWWQVTITDVFMPNYCDMYESFAYKPKIIFFHSPMKYKLLGTSENGGALLDSHSVLEIIVYSQTKIHLYCYMNRF